MNPKHPVYVVSKGRWDTRLTSKVLENIKVPYHIVIDADEHEEYANVIDPEKILTVPLRYYEDYDTCDELGDEKSKGPGGARNFCWDHSVENGHDWHWVMDDNIPRFYRFNRNRLIRFGDGTPFRVMEDFAERYVNVVMAGPNYQMFVPRKKHKAPITLNTRIYSCNLIRNNVPFRWRGRYNEDTDLSLRMLKAGYCTMLFNAFVQDKLWTQTVRGGNTAEFYEREGTLPKSLMQVAMHPDVSRMVWRFQRWHHHVDYDGFKQRPILREGLKIGKKVDDYGMRLVEVSKRGTGLSAPA